MKKKIAHWMSSTPLLAVACALLLASGGPIPAAQEAETTGEKTEKTEKKDSYPLDTCPVSGEKLGGMGEPVVRHYEGREVRFCCAHCIESFEEDLEASLKKLDELIIARQKPDYPLDVCLVSGEKLGGMGEPIDYVHDNQLVRFCCAHCIESFEEAPEKHLEKLHAAYAAQKKSREEKSEREPGGHQGH